MCVYVHVHAYMCLPMYTMTCIERQKTTFQSWLSLSAMWVLEVELRSAALTEGTNVL